MADPRPAEMFWMVCRLPTHPASKTEPKARYLTEAEARRAAEELASQNGARFVVLAPCYVTPVRAEHTPGLF